MKPISPELSRNSILLQLEAAYPASLPSRTIRQGLFLNGLHFSESALLKELQYLKEKQLITPNPSPVTGFINRFSLSAQGLDYLENQNLA